MKPKTLADVIAIVVANCTGLSCPWDVCSLLLVDSNCRHKLQEKEVTGHMRVDDRLTRCRLDDAVERALMITSFVCWLPKHAGLVSRLTVSSKHIGLSWFDRSHMPGHWICPTDKEWLLLQQQLALALQLCRVSAADHNAASQPLHLRHCTINGPLQVPNLLRELGAVGLPKLYLWVNPPITGNTNYACMSALAKMTSLKTLLFALDPAGQPGVPAQVVSQLTQLSRLEVSLPAGAAAQLPSSLEHLVLACPTGQDSDTQEPDELDLQHLTALQELTLLRYPSTSIKLPPHVTQLDVKGNEPPEHVTGGGEELRVVFDVFGDEGLATLAVLSRLPNITSMKVSWDSFDCFIEDIPPGGLDAALQAAAALSLASSLTMLEFDEPLAYPAVVPWGRSIATPVGLYQEQQPPRQRVCLAAHRASGSAVLGLCSSNSSVTLVSSMWPCSACPVAFIIAGQVLGISSCCCRHSVTLLCIRRQLC